MEYVMCQDGSRRLRPSNTYNPRAWRWLNIKQAAAKKCLVKAINREEAFCFRPYSYTPWGITTTQLFCEESEKINLPSRETYPPKAQTQLAIMAPSLLHNKMESMESIRDYNPQRVLRQLGYEQGTIGISGDATCSSALNTKNMSVGEGRHQILMEAERYSARGWDKLGSYHLGKFCFGRSMWSTQTCIQITRKSLLERAMPTSIKAKDLYYGSGRRSALW